MSEHNPNNKECSWNGFLHKHDEEGWCPMTYCDCTCATQQEKQDWDTIWDGVIKIFHKGEYDKGFNVTSPMMNRSYSYLKENFDILIAKAREEGRRETYDFIRKETDYYCKGNNMSTEVRMLILDARAEVLQKIEEWAKKNNFTDSWNLEAVYLKDLFTFINSLK